MNNKALPRRIIALASTGFLGFFSYLALVGQADLDVFWRVFAAFNVYLLWFFGSRQNDKRAEHAPKLHIDLSDEAIRQIDEAIRQVKDAEK